MFQVGGNDSGRSVRRRERKRKEKKEKRKGKEGKKRKKGKIERNRKRLAGSSSVHRRFHCQNLLNQELKLVYSTRAMRRYQNQKVSLKGPTREIWKIEVGLRKASQPVSTL